MENNINKDFEKIIQQKLLNHSLPVDADIWKGIEAKLKPTPKKVIPFWYWVSSASAVAVILLLIGVFNFTDHKSNFELAETKTSSNQNQEVKVNAPTKQPINDLVTQTIIQTPVSHQLKINKNKKSNKKNTLSSPKDTIKISENTNTDLEIANENVIRNEYGQIDIITGNKEIVQNKVFGENDEIKSKTTESKKSLIIEEQNKDWQDEFIKQPENEWVLIASVGSGSSGASPNSKMEMEQPIFKSSILKAPTLNTSILAPSDFSERNYSAPLTFAFTANKRILKNVSLETGLNYTYLYTSLKDRRATADFSLHYIGIPLNLLYKIWNNNKWSIYTSAGLTAEKGIWSVYRQDEFVGNQTITTNVTKKIPGMQWSVQGAMGITYAILDEMDIYFEPKISKFFENDQPISIRSENKLVIGISGGFRWNF